MPVLPNPDPQVWRMLLGSMADEILNPGEKEKDDSSRAPDTAPDITPEGELRPGSPGRNRGVGNR